MRALRRSGEPVNLKGQVGTVRFAWNTLPDLRVVALDPKLTR